LLYYYITLHISCRPKLVLPCSYCNERDTFSITVRIIAIQDFVSAGSTEAAAVSSVCEVRPADVLMGLHKLYWGFDCYL